MVPKICVGKISVEIWILLHQLVLKLNSSANDCTQLSALKVLPGFKVRRTFLFCRVNIWFANSFVGIFKRHL